MEKIYDIIIVGGGPAGLTAAIYAARANMSVLVLEKENVGSLLLAHKIDNYPGFDSISGKELQELMKEQAKKFNTEFKKATVLGFDPYEETKMVKTDVGNYKSKYIIIATGTGKFGNKKIKGEAKYIGAGVSYCATCDGAFTRGKIVSLVGKGEELLEEALFLTRYAEKVNVYLTAADIDCEENLKEALLSNEKIEIQKSVVLNEIIGDGEFVTALKLTVNDVELEVKTDFVFLYLGTKNNLEFFGEFAEISSNGYIITNDNMEIRAKGMYAVGDVREKEFRQITTATSDGTIAATIIVKDFLKNKRNK